MIMTFYFIFDKMIMTFLYTKHQNL